MTDVARWARRRLQRFPLVEQAAETGWRLLQLAVRRRKINRYLEQTDRVRLMIGAGPSQREGWLATDLLPSRRDVVVLDAGKPFPFPSRTVDRMHSEHMIEHVDYATGARMLAECFRVLKPGGRVRLATPDIDRVLALASPTPEVAELVRAANRRHGLDEPEASEPIHAINRLFSGHGHRFLYSETVLSRRMAEAGFVSIRRFEVGASDDPEFTGAEQHGEQIDPAWNEYQTLVLEAEKPRLRVR